jgi:hypothetical protein
MDLNKSGWAEFCRVNHEHTHEKLKKQFSNYDHRHQRAGSYGKYALGAGLVQTARLTGSDDH